MRNQTMSNIDDMPLFRIHTARKMFETNNYSMYQACLWSGVIENNGHFLNVKKIEILKTDGTYRTEYPRD